MNFWKTYNNIIGFLVPDWLFKWLKKHPFTPLLIILVLYIINFVAGLV